MLILTVAGLEDSALNLLPETDEIISAIRKPIIRKDSFVSQ